MKTKRSLGIALAALLLLTLIPAVGVMARPAAQEQNLLANPGFEEGWYDVDVGQVPNGWELNWLANTEHPETGAYISRTESRVLPVLQVPVRERDLYFRDGTYCVKIFWADTPIYVALSQKVSNLEVGRKYRFDVPIYGDTFQWKEEEGGKVPPPDPFTARVRLGVGTAGSTWLDMGAIHFGGSWSGEYMYLQYNVYSMEFTATEPEMKLYIYMDTKWGGLTSGFFLDGLGLYALGMDTPPTNTPPPPPPTITPGPSPTPLPPPTPRPDGSIVHVVQSGDTVWSIAIQYASSMGLSPEEMKAQIERLNTIGQFLNVGQELVISVPTGEQPQPTAPPTAAPTAASGEGEPPAEPQSEPGGAAEAPAAVEVPAAAAAGDGEASTICVSAYHDRNADGMRDPAADEGLLPGVEFKLSSGAGLVDAYTSDGVSEPHCFEQLPEGTYMIEAQTPAGYHSTTPDALAIPLQPGTTVNIELGNQRTGGEVEVADASAADSGAAAESEGEGSAAEADGGSDGLFSKLGDIAIGISGVFVLLLALAVGIALIASRQR